ncbi:unnamed protein product [Colias eurytheme]|nr:unnamed protein product [Colias eurytheme]
MQVEEKSVFQVFQEDRHLPDCVEEDTLHPNVKNSIGRIIKNEGYLTFKIQAEALTADGGNFMGKLFVVRITGRTGEGEKEINLFIKQALGEDIFQEHMSMSEAYLREVYFYTELNALYKKLQLEANIQPHEMLKTVKCYNESSTDAIILENLKVKGFNVLFRMDVMSIQFAEAAIKELAKFHALSFVVQKKMPDYFNNKKKTFKPVVRFNEHFEQFTSKSVKLAVQRLDEPVKEKITSNYSVLFSNYAKYMTDTVSSVNCFCHGDYRPNNILMKYNDEAIEEVIPIDYQLLFYGSPITDLIYLLYTGTDGTFRKKHENHLKELYFSTLKDFLHNFDVDVEAVFPRKTFDNDYESIREYGFYLALVILPFILCEENDIPDFENVPATEIELKIDERYFPRMAEIYDEFKHLIKL